MCCCVCVPPHAAQPAPRASPRRGTGSGAAAAAESVRLWCASERGRLGRAVGARRAGLRGRNVTERDLSRLPGGSGACLRAGSTFRAGSAHDKLMTEKISRLASLRTTSQRFKRRAKALKCGKPKPFAKGCKFCGAKPGRTLLYTAALSKNDK